MTREKCTQCGGLLIQTGTFDGMRIMTHVSKKRAKKCLQIDAIKTMSEHTERMFNAIDQAKKEREQKEDAQDYRDNMKTLEEREFRTENFFVKKR